MNYQRELEFARSIATVAGQNATDIRARGIGVETKPDASPVTIADKENERLICEAIEREFPDDGILAEEGSSKAGSSGRRWIIDPIDGTATTSEAIDFGASWSRSKKPTRRSPAW